MTDRDPRYDAIVIGAGIEELIAAGYLARAGLRVLQLERATRAGGTAVTEELVPGFRFDSCADDVGPLPARIARELGVVGLVPLSPDPVLFAPQPNGDPLFLWRDAVRTRESIRSRSPADADRWEGFCEQMGRFAGWLEALYLDAPPRPAATGVKELASLLGFGRRLRGLGRTDMVELLRLLPMPAYDLLNDWFESEALKAALATGSITGVFQGPRSAGTAFVLLHHQVGRRAGEFGPRFMVRGGIGRLSEALAETAGRRGVDLRFAAEVAGLAVGEGRALGVRLESGEELAARAVVSGADPRRTFLHFVDPIHLEPDFISAVENIRFRGARARVHLALSGLPRFQGPEGDEWLRAGGISIGPTLDYLELAYDDAKHGAMSRRPILSARIPSLDDSTLCPPGRHVMSISMQYAPYRLKDGPWDDARRQALGDLVVDTLAEHAPDLPGLILERRVLTPQDMEQNYGITEGHLYHGELALDQILFMRPVPGWAHYRTPIRGLYLCGPGTHPGGGLTGASGRNAARAVIEDVRTDREG